MNNNHSLFNKTINHKTIIKPENFIKYKEEANR